MATEYAQWLADRYNAALTRTDIEWAVNAQGNLYLRDKPEWTRHQTAMLEQRAERERREWMRNNQHRPSPPAFDARTGECPEQERQS